MRIKATGSLVPLHLVKTKSKSKRTVQKNLPLGRQQGTLARTGVWEQRAGFRVGVRFPAADADLPPPELAFDEAENGIEV